DRVGSGAALARHPVGPAQEHDRGGRQPQARHSARARAGLLFPAPRGWSAPSPGRRKAPGRHVRPARQSATYPDAV
ncbi:MAG: hypothetical protein AVDCRST_MAG34-1745, partial [uncultured Nocardioidaceae bacterium]